MSSNDIVRRPNSILRKSLAEVINNQKAPEELRLRADFSHITPGHAIPPPVAEMIAPEPEPEPEHNVDPRQILNSIGEVVYTWDLNSDQLVWGANLSDVLPTTAPDVINTGMGWAELLAGESPSSRYAAVKESSGRDTGPGVPFQVYYCLSDGSGQSIWIEDTGRWFGGPRGEAVKAHGVIRVVTERYEADRRLIYQSKYDALTGAFNRDQLTKHLATSVEAAIREQRPLTVLLANIDNLGIINRAYGYHVADEVIAGLARNLRAHMRGADVIARFAGNKFAFVLESCDAEQMVIAARRFLKVTNTKPIATSVGPVQATLRIGGVGAPRHGRTQQVLLQHAEEALEMARGNATDRFAVYSESLVRHDARMCAAEVTREITSAMADDRIELALQPVIDSRTGKPAFFESLVRLRRQDGSLIQPDTFLPTAERVGLIKLLDQRMLDLTVDYLRQNPEVRLAFNVSPATAHDPEWPLRLKAAIGPDAGIAKRLIVEITETFAIDNLDTTNRVIEEMKAVGVSVAMDDFGSGHTSFRGLRHLKFDLIKIDGAFIQNLARSADDRIFVRALVDLARHIGVPIVGEWIEDAETARILTEWGVQYLQGHYFGKAQTLSERLASAPLMAKSA